MVYLIAKLAAKSEAAEAVAAGLATLEQASRAEPGCVRYEVYRGVANAAVFTVVEQWADQAALDQHLAGPPFQAFAAACGDKFAAEPVLEFMVPLGR